jgi:flagellar motility protein MotE (MotC chaperone)
MADEKLMKFFNFKLISGLVCTCVLLAGSWAYAQNSQTAPDLTPKAETEPPQLPTQPASVSPETLRLLEMIERKNQELKKREKELLLKEKNLQLLEEKVLSDLQKIEEALARSEEMVGIKKDLIEKNVKGLVKAYSNMKPVQAAALLEDMDQGIAIIIISRMKSRIAGKVLGAMNTKIAKGISEKIAGKKTDSN